MESDSLLAIIEVENINNSSCEWEGISMDIRQSAQAFQSCRFKHIRRGSNSLAHKIASVAISPGDYKVWRQSLPLSVCNWDCEN